MCIVGEVKKGRGEKGGGVEEKEEEKKEERKRRRKEIQHKYHHKYPFRDCTFMPPIKCHTCDIAVTLHCFFPCMKDTDIFKLYGV